MRMHLLSLYTVSTPRSETEFMIGMLKYCSRPLPGFRALVLYFDCMIKAIVPYLYGQAQKVIDEYYLMTFSLYRLINIEEGTIDL